MHGNHHIDAMNGIVFSLLQRLHLIDLIVVSKSIHHAYYMDANHVILLMYLVYYLPVLFYATV